MSVEFTGGKSMVEKGASEKILIKKMISHLLFYGMKINLMNVIGGMLKKMNRIIMNA